MEFMFDENDGVLVLISQDGITIRRADLSLPYIIIVRQAALDFSTFVFETAEDEQPITELKMTLPVNDIDPEDGIPKLAISNYEVIYEVFRYIQALHDNAQRIRVLQTNELVIISQGNRFPVQLLDILYELMKEVCAPILGMVINESSQEAR